VRTLSKPEKRLDDRHSGRHAGGVMTRNPFMPVIALVRRSLMRRRKKYRAKRERRSNPEEKVDTLKKQITKLLIQGLCGWNADWKSSCRPDI